MYVCQQVHSKSVSGVDGVPVDKCFCHIIRLAGATEIVDVEGDVLNHGYSSVIIQPCEYQFEFWVEFDNETKGTINWWRERRELGSRGNDRSKWLDFVLVEGKADIWLVCKSY